MDERTDAGANGNNAANGEDKEKEPAPGSNDKLMVDLHKYLLLLAILAATVTYVAGLNPPGGVWLDTQDGHLTGNQILVVTYHARYNAFSYSNATAFMASAVVILLLLLEVKTERRKKRLLVALRIVMSLDMLALVVAYAAGASRDVATTALASVLVFPIFVYVLLHTIMDSVISKKVGDLFNFENNSPAATGTDTGTDGEKRRKILMLLALFATTVTYTAGLNPPGGFWPVGDEGHRAGDPVLPDHHRHRFLAFFICNTASFVASLSAIMLLLTHQFFERFFKRSIADSVPYVLMVISLLSLAAAYAAGSCRGTACTAGVPLLYMVALAVICFAAWLMWPDRDSRGDEANTGNHTTQAETAKTQDNKNISCSVFISPILAFFYFLPQKDPDQDHHQDPDDGLNLKKGRSLVLLLATLAATVTYQAGLNPPGGFWPDNRDGHMGGDPILLSKHAMRYRVFFYCNSMALATSLVVIFMVLRNLLDNISTKKHGKRLVVLVTVMILDLFSLIGAFAAGCGRDVSTSIYAVALAGGTLVYVVLHMVFFARRRHDNDDGGKKGGGVEKTRKRLLLLAILAATLTYQAGLTPPGGFWLADDGDGELGHHAGDPVLLSNYPGRYAAFFYLNSTGFMASVALTILLVNKNLYRAAINCHALHVCVVAALFALMGAYAAGSSRHVRTSIYMIALIGAALFSFLIILLVLKKCCGDRAHGAVKVTASVSPDGGNSGSAETTGQHSMKTEEGGGRADGTVKPTASIPPDGGNRGSAETMGQHSTETEEGGDRARGTVKADSKDSNTRLLHTQRKYLMFLGILAASVSYQAGLAPPGGVWPDNSDGHVVGNPILRDSNRRRYHIFFYCNSISFVASMVVITLQLLVELITGGLLKTKAKWYEEDAAKKILIQAALWTMVVNLIGLLGAYAAGSSREWETSGYIVGLAAAVASYIGIHFIVSFLYGIYAGDGKQEETSHA